MNLTAAGLAGMILAASYVGGCSGIQPTPTLPADAFVTNRQVIGPGSGQPVDHSGPLVYDAQHRPRVGESSGVEHISETVRESVKSPTDQAGSGNESDFPPPAPNPVPSTPLPPVVTHPSGVTSGQWQSIGTVLAVVNGEPIYSHKVVNTLDRALAAEARTGTEDHFRSVAEDLVIKQIREFIDNDLEYAAAQQSLEKSDEQVAKFVTAEWRKEQVRKAGGSEALARQARTRMGLTLRNRFSSSTD